MGHPIKLYLAEGSDSNLVCENAFALARSVVQMRCLASAYSRGLCESSRIFQVPMCFPHKGVETLTLHQSESPRRGEELLVCFQVGP
jgi:hypothetical protein